MGEIMPFKRKGAGSLNEFLDRAVLLRKKIVNIQNGILTDVKAVERLFEGQISGVLIDNRLVSEGFFLCGIYIAGILRDFIHFCPESWYAVDYLKAAAEKDNPLFLKNGADICFIVCSLFEGRTNRARRATSKKNIYSNRRDALLSVFFGNR
jgi:hypothetical protein